MKNQMATEVHTSAGSQISGMERMAFPVLKAEGKDHKDQGNFLSW